MLQPGASSVGEEQGEVADDEVVVVRSTQLAGQAVVREPQFRSRFPRVCDTPVSPRVSLRKPNQEPLFHVNQSKHEHQINLSNKEFTKYMLKSVIIKTIETFER